jgi:hypothetical protein
MKKLNRTQKIIYLIIIILLFGVFVYVSKKYTREDVEGVKFNDYYKDIDGSHIDLIFGSEFIKLIDDEDVHVFLIGDRENEWSQKYVELVSSIVKDLDVDIYYYDIVNDKSQENSNYYRIVKKLNGYLMSDDSSDNNFLSPSLYIIKDGKVLFYDAETSVVKNSDEVDAYWTEEREQAFRQKITAEIHKYVLTIATQ